MLRDLSVLYSTSKLQMKQSLARPTYKFCLAVQPIIYSIITYMMFKDSGQKNFAAFAILGTGILTLWSTICFSSAGDIERERYSGTLEAIYSTPTDFRTIILGKIIGNTLLGIAPFIISFVIIKFIFGAQVYINNIPTFLVSFLIALISFMGISILFATWFTLSRDARMLMNCIEYPVFILCGVLFPIEILPAWTRPFSYALSPTWAVKLLRMSIEGITDVKLFYSYMLILLIITICYFLSAYLLFNRIDKQTRIKASLGVS